MSDSESEVMPKMGLLTGEVESSLTNITNYKIFAANYKGANNLKRMIEVKLNYFNYLLLFKIIIFSGSV